MSLIVVIFLFMKHSNAEPSRHHTADAFEMANELSANVTGSHFRGACSASTPPSWPVRFKVRQRKVPANDQDCSAGSCSNVTTYYDWERQANLIVDQPDDPAKTTLWDLELGNQHSYYFHPANKQCSFIHFAVGILRRDWLDGANYTGVSVINGRHVLGWTKADFIDYYADADDCTPVRWYFHGMKASFDTISYLEGEMVPDVSFFEPPSYCPNRTTELPAVDQHFTTGSEFTSFVDSIHV
eukprot:gnl/TRDRNA2_/TRDRNA2_82813_c0_seq1.p1 gnl/TRDRNA2_/TRDRNA2_82813_c0~~gnl/TRDRNA2_/TRDRNA2_82813_c0_seq1.p1  ORF type:complete len:241 (-),score=28.98 gnl/TRDRNA2_/TRDRNA2_82813_c0_seq1:53-775(-)